MQKAEGGRRLQASSLGEKARLRGSKSGMVTWMVEKECVEPRCHCIN